MNCKYMAVALDRRARLRGDDIGVLKPVLADGMYRNRQDAWGVAEYMKWKHPEYRCLVVEVLEEVEIDPRRDDDIIDQGDFFE
mgnify:CR=1 FL=1